VPPDLHPWAAEVGQSWINFLQTAGVNVIGNADDLIGANDPSVVSYWDPDKLSGRRRYRPALAALAAMTEEAAKRESTLGGVGRLIRVGADRMSAK
jgi:hypothetical protein